MSLFFSGANICLKDYIKQSKNKHVIYTCVTVCPLYLKWHVLWLHKTKENVANKIYSRTLGPIGNIPGKDNLLVIGIFPPPSSYVRRFFPYIKSEFDISKLKYKDKFNLRANIIKQEFDRIGKEKC